MRGEETRDGWVCVDVCTIYENRGIGPPAVFVPDMLVTTIENCCEYCKSYTGCLGWVFTDPGPACFLRVVTEPIFDPGYPATAGILGVYQANGGKPALTSVFFYFRRERSTVRLYCKKLQLTKSPDVHCHRTPVI